MKKSYDLGVIEVKEKAEDKQFVQSGSKSTRTGLNEATQSIDSIVRGVPGNYTQIDQAHGGISVNVRGMSGFGRVNTMVDGVKQTNFSSASDDGNWHGQIGTSTSTALIDENFLTSAEFERGTFSSAGGSNSLMGSANFRTLDVNDIVRDGENFGFLGRYSYGTNGIGPKYMLSVAGRNSFDDKSGHIGVLYGYSGKRISQNYKTGSGQKIGDIHAPFDSDDDGVPDTFLDSPINPEKLKQKPKGHLFKVEFSKNDNEAKFTFRNHENNLAGRKISANTYQLDYAYHPDTPYVNLKSLIAFTRNSQKYNDGERWAYHDVSGVRTKNDAMQVNLNNTFHFDYSDEFKHDLEVGVNFLRNDYKNNFPQDRVMLPYILTSFYPQGTQDIRSLYANNNIKSGIFEIEANLDFTHSNVYGNKRECYQIDAFCPEMEARKVSKNFDNLNYSFLVSAEISPYFTPFISYARTSRIPNVQEWFYTHDSYGEGHMNRNIKEEKADTYQIGFNAFNHGVFSSNDTLGFKATYFNSKVKNYMYDRFWVGDNYSYMFLNLINDDKKATFKGIEIEGKYDIGFAYANLSYTYQKSKRNYGDSEAVEFGSAYYGKSQFMELPRHSARLDLGGRFFNEKLVVGTLLKYTGKAKRLTPVGSLDDDPNTPNALSQKKTSQEIPSIPTIVDLYASYETPIRGLSIKAEVQNLFDKDYMDALYTYNSVDSTQNIGGLTDPIFIFNNSARGRTFVLNFQYKY